MWPVTLVKSSFLSKSRKTHAQRAETFKRNGWKEKNTQTQNSYRIRNSYPNPVCWCLSTCSCSACNMHLPRKCESCLLSVIAMVIAWNARYGPICCWIFAAYSDIVYVWRLRPFTAVPRPFALGAIHAITIFFDYVSILRSTHVSFRIRYCVPTTTTVDSMWEGHTLCVRRCIWSSAWMKRYDAFKWISALARLLHFHRHCAVCSSWMPNICCWLHLFRWSSIYEQRMNTNKPVRQRAIVIGSKYTQQHFGSE